MHAGNEQPLSPTGPSATHPYARSRGDARRASPCRTYEVLEIGSAVGARDATVALRWVGATADGAAIVDIAEGTEVATYRLGACGALAPVSPADPLPAWHAVLFSTVPPADLTLQPGASWIRRWHGVRARRPRALPAAAEHVRYQVLGATAEWVSLAVEVRRGFTRLQAVDASVTHDWQTVLTASVELQLDLGVVFYAQGTCREDDEEWAFAIALVDLC